MGGPGLLFVGGRCFCRLARFVEADDHMGGFGIHNGPTDGLRVKYDDMPHRSSPWLNDVKSTQILCKDHTGNLAVQAVGIPCFLMGKLRNCLRVSPRATIIQAQLNGVGEADEGRRLVRDEEGWNGPQIVGKPPFIFKPAAKGRAVEPSPQLKDDTPPDEDSAARAEG